MIVACGVGFILGAVAVFFGCRELLKRADRINGRLKSKIIMLEREIFDCRQDREQLGELLNRRAEVLKNAEAEITDLRAMLGKRGLKKPETAYKVVKGDLKKVDE